MYKEPLKDLGHDWCMINPNGSWQKLKCNYCGLIALKNKDNMLLVPHRWYATECTRMNEISMTEILIDEALEKQKEEIIKLKEENKTFREMLSHVERVLSYSPNDRSGLKEQIHRVLEGKPRFPEPNLSETERKDLRKLIDQINNSKDIKNEIKKINKEHRRLPLYMDKDYIK